ncbi:MAG: tRNA uridine-5-carboxymethylaminomethyl(34) synthesis GTPase MnmE, partial [Planctomycetota bacterium]
VLEGRLDASAADSLYNARQRDAVRRALERISGAREAVRAGMGYEFAAVDLREATDALGEITGKVGGQDVLDRVFSRFCVGK